MFVPDLFHFWLNEIITSFLYSLEGTGGGVTAKNKHYPFFCYCSVWERLLQNCSSTHWKHFDSISQVLERSLTMNCYICLVIFTSPMTCYLYIVYKTVVCLYCLWFIYFSITCWTLLNKSLLLGWLWIIWRGVWVKCGAILTG